MKRVPILCAVVAAVATLQAHAQVRTTSAIAKSAGRATVVIEVFDDQGQALGFGSGFIVRDDGVIVTNAHVLEGASRARVTLPTGEAFDRVQALDIDAARDVAIIKIAGFGLPVLQAKATLPGVGEKVVVIGAPRGLAQTVSEGIVSGVRMREGVELMQLTAAISPGSSGGPVLDASGAVVAVATAYRTDGQSLNFAMPVRYAMGLLAESPTPKPLASFATAAPSGQAEETASEGADWLRLPEPSPKAEASWLVNSFPVAGRTHASFKSGNVKVYEHYGFLLIAAENTGLFFHAFTDVRDTTEKYFVVEFITSAFATPDGRLSVTVLDDASYNGWFTEGGGVALTARQTTPTETRPSIVARYDTLVAKEPRSPALHKPFGLYAVTWNSEIKYKKDRAEAQWTGMAASAVSNDSVWFSMRVSHPELDSRSYFFAGPVVSDKFTLVNDDGTSLVGSLNGGQFSAVLLDKSVKDARIEGRISGQRR